MVQVAGSTSTDSEFSMLDGHQFISLTTYRKNGEAVATPVWFVDVGNKLYVMTMRTSGKAKRIGHTQRVTIAACDRAGALLGESREAMARIVGEDERAAADAMVAQKYGEQKKMFDARLTDPNDRVFIAITAEYNAQFYPACNASRLVSWSAQTTAFFRRLVFQIGR